MQIEVEYRNILPEDVELWVDGVCQHRLTDTESIENFSGVKGITTYCTTCNAEYNELDEAWIPTGASYRL